MIEYWIIGILWLIFVFLLLIFPVLFLIFVGAKRERRRFAVCNALAVLGAEILITFLLCIQPPIINLTDQTLTFESENTIRCVSDGRYNSTLPVFPTAVVVTQNKAKDGE